MQEPSLVSRSRPCRVTSVTASCPIKPYSKLRDTSAAMVEQEPDEHYERCLSGKTSRAGVFRKDRYADMSSQHPQNKSEMPGAEVVRLVDMVNYQEGAVVSRTLMKRTTGTITLFAFDDGQGLSEHTTPYDAVAQVLEGEAEISVSGKPLLTKAGEAVLLPANQPHALKAVSRFKMLLTMVRL